MIGALKRNWDAFRGSGEAAVTIPPMDGALRPNTLLEQAPGIAHARAPDDLACDCRMLWFSTGKDLMQLPRIGAEPERLMSFNSPITALAVAPSGILAVAQESGRITLVRDGYETQVLEGLGSLSPVCMTALMFASDNELVVAQGSATRPNSDWKRDLMERQATGSVWRINLGNGEANVVAKGLSWPYGLARLTDGDLAVSESWKHRVVRINPRGEVTPLLSDLPGYPARISAGSNGGFWLAIFAPRNQIIEFIQREPAFLNRMLTEVDPAYWAAPSLKPSATFLEPLQGGAQKHLGMLKPWAPSRSYGLVVQTDARFRPIRSWHSRADGTRHGVMACVPWDGRVIAACKGGDALVAIDAGSRTASLLLAGAA